MHDSAERSVSVACRCRVYVLSSQTFIPLSLHSSGAFSASGDPHAKRGQGQKTLKSKCQKNVAEAPYFCLVFFVACATPLFALARVSLWGRGCAPKTKSPRRVVAFCSVNSQNFISAPPSPHLRSGFRLDTSTHLRWLLDIMFV